MATRTDKTKGVGFTGPVEITAPAGESAYAALTPYSLTSIGDTTTTDQSGNIETNLTDIKTLLDAILERLA